MNDFEQNLNNNLELLKACQINLGLNSCMDCSKIFDCQTRKDYVKSVYNSMSKGGGGEFDF
ncbi:MAG: hypothetical protein E7K04_00835 [Helicobacter sp.]|nr:hypothetical protein [Helicobacter sp.]